MYEIYLLMNELIQHLCTEFNHKVMSEFINNSKRRINELHAFISGITLQGKGAGAKLIRTYEKAIEQAQAFDVVAVVDSLMQENIELEKLKTGLNRSLNMLYKSLVSRPIPDYDKKPFFKVLQSENNALNECLIELRTPIKAFNAKDADKDQIENALQAIAKAVESLGKFNLHYIKKENILFPYIEKHLPEYRCLPMMWSYHDDIRNYQKEIIELIQKKPVNLKRLNRLLGDLFFNMYAIRFREEYILFPVVFDMIPEAEMFEMMEQAFDVGFAFIQTPEKSRRNKKVVSKPSETIQAVLHEKALSGKLLDFGTGLMTIDQAVMLLNHLPVDVTLVNEKDEVRYFSTPGHRIFPRSKAIIGRLVENCHPPSSVHIVKQLVDDFRNGKKEKESFWIQMGKKFILIQYFALRDEQGNYCGTLEVSQDVTDIRKLKGEKRLME